MIDIQSIIDEQEAEINNLTPNAFLTECEEEEEIEMAEDYEMTKGVDETAIMQEGKPNFGKENDTNGKKNQFEIVENPYYDIGPEDKNKDNPCKDSIPDLNEIEIITTTENIYYEGDCWTMEYSWFQSKIILDSKLVIENI